MAIQPRNGDHASAGSMSPKTVPSKHPVASTAALSAPSVPAAGTSADARVLTYMDVASAGLPSKAALPVDSDGFEPLRWTLPNLDDNFSSGFVTLLLCPSS
jgi:hypothetical protein